MSSCSSFRSGSSCNPVDHHTFRNIGTLIALQNIAEQFQFRKVRIFWVDCSPVWVSTPQRDSHSELHQRSWFLCIRANRTMWRLQFRDLTHRTCSTCVNFLSCCAIPELVFQQCGRWHWLFPPVVLNSCWNWVGEQSAGWKRQRKGHFNLRVSRVASCFSGLIIGAKMRSHLTRLNRPPGRVSSSSNQAKGETYITKGGCVSPSFLDLFILLLFLRMTHNPYLHHSPSGLLAPDATDRLFSDWAIWAALCWNSIESKYSVSSCWDCSFFLFFLCAHSQKNLNTY